MTDPLVEFFVWCFVLSPMFFIDDNYANYRNATFLSLNKFIVIRSTCNVQAETQ